MQILSFSPRTKNFLKVSVYTYRNSKLKEISKQPVAQYFETYLRFNKFPFTTSETELDYCHQKLDVPLASQVAERLKT